MNAAQASRLRNPKWSGHCGGPTACRSKEDISCELLILLPSIVQPSVLTGCSQCSTAPPALTVARRDTAVQYRADWRERLSDLRRSRWFLRARAVHRGEREHADHPRREADQPEKKSEVLYQGIAARAFERVFQLAEHVEVKGASSRTGSCTSISSVKFPKPRSRARSRSAMAMGMSSTLRPPD